MVTLPQKGKEKSQKEQKTRESKQETKGRFLRKIAEQNRKSLRFEIAISKSQCVSALEAAKNKSKVPKISEIE